MEFYVPLKPVRVSEIWQGRRFKTPVYTKYERDLALFLPKEHVDGNVEVTIEFFLKNHKRSDVDNLLKALLDCMTKGQLYEDDSRIYILHVYKRPVGAGREEGMRIRIDGIK